MHVIIASATGCCNCTSDYVWNDLLATASGRYQACTQSLERKILDSVNCFDFDVSILMSALQPHWWMWWDLQPL